MGGEVEEERTVAATKQSMASLSHPMVSWETHLNGKAVRIIHMWTNTIIFISKQVKAFKITLRLFYMWTNTILFTIILMSILFSRTNKSIVGYIQVEVLCQGTIHERILYNKNQVPIIKCIEKYGCTIFTKYIVYSI